MLQDMIKRMQDEDYTIRLSVLDEAILTPLRFPSLLRLTKEESEMVVKAQID